MTRHLLILTLGPVQDFIAQARRMRDLWFGSELLCRLARAAADVLQARGAQLIFPHPSQLDAGTGVANKVVTLVEGDPRALAAAARDAARSLLVSEGLAAFDKHQDQLVEPSARDAAREQLETLLELHAAWAPCPDDSSYAAALEQAEAAIAGHKTLRPFAPWRHTVPDAHKSSLDGARASVLRRGPRDGKAWREYRIGLREELDAVGLLKRTTRPPGQFVPVPTIGLAAWVERAQARCPRELESLRQRCEALGFTRVRRAWPWVQALPFDAQVLLPERWEPYLAEHGCSREQARDFGRRFVQPLLHELGEPFPYVACLAADGDHMGHTLRALASQGPAAHQRLSEGLSRFSRAARRLVEESGHRGVLVYAGGDDVLAFLCPQDALACAEALRDAFAAEVTEALAGTGVTPPTLSVGVGFGHVLASLGDLLDLGRKAEQAAKAAKRNALAVVVERHSGRTRTWAAQWTEPVAPVARLGADVGRLTSGQLPLSKVREVGSRLRHLTGGRAGPDTSGLGDVLGREARRILARTSPGGSPAPLRLDELGLELAGPPGSEVTRALETWVARQEVAAFLADAQPRPTPPGGRS